MQAQDPLLEQLDMIEATIYAKLNRIDGNSLSRQGNRLSSTELSAACSDVLSASVGVNEVISTARLDLLRVMAGAEARTAALATTARSVAHAMAPGYAVASAEMERLTTPNPLPPPPPLRTSPAYNVVLPARSLYSEVCGAGVPDLSRSCAMDILDTLDKQARNASYEAARGAATGAAGARGRRGSIVTTSSVETPRREIGITLDVDEEVGTADAATPRTRDARRKSIAVTEDFTDELRAEAMASAVELANGMRALSVARSSVSSTGRSPRRHSPRRMVAEPEIPEASDPDSSYLSDSYDATDSEEQEQGQQGTAEAYYAYTPVENRVQEMVPDDSFDDFESEESSTLPAPPPRPPQLPAAISPARRPPPLDVDVPSYSSALSEISDM